MAKRDEERSDYTKSVIGRQIRSIAVLFRLDTAIYERPAIFLERDSHVYAGRNRFSHPVACYLCPRNGRVKSGRGDWIRTSGPLRPRQVRYQAALRPDI